ncbi:GyrI-like domain-containing protein [Rhizobacter sp. LjRoot28]|jgi:hypothetical protein|uniref:GyrI-like domain-containing protein n=1 Tax=Rhizobacter sp. LjRoot28 TaxID=3342309 RepID=UPI003ECEBEBE
MASLITPPRIEHRAARHCAVIRSEVTMAQLATDLPPLGDEVLRALTQQGIKRAGPWFWRYRVIDMDALLTVDVGLPVDEVFVTEGRVLSDTLPAGNYLTTRFRGHPSGLEEATAELLAWGDAHRVTWAKKSQGCGEAWAARIEWYLEEPADMSQWVTELAFLVE